MGLGILRRSLIAATAVLSAIASQPAKAAVYDVTLGGTMSGVRFSSLNSSNGGSGFRRFSVRFEDIGTGSAQVNDVRVDELAFRMASSSGDTFDDNFENAWSNGSSFFRAAITAAHRTSTSTTFFHRGFFDRDGTLSVQSVSIAAVPIPTGLLLMLTGLAGLGFVARNRIPRA